jgi:hypothetical protein
VHPNYYGKTKAGKTTLDNLNTEIEDKSAPSLKKLINSPGTVTPADRVALSFLFANIFLRNPPHISKWACDVITSANKIDEMVKQTSEG